MRLMIVESPNKVKKISAALGDGWQVEASVGHVRDLPEREVGIEPPDFALNYVPSERSKMTLAKLRKAAADADKVVLATDPDREGEAISWHLFDALGLRADQVERVTFNAIEPAAIRAAVAKPRKIDMQLVHAQEARRAVDRLVGYLVSPVLSEAKGEPVSAGRVQSPAVRLVVEREAQIKGFKPTKHFGVVASFGTWAASWDTKPHLAEGEEYVLDCGLAERAAQSRDFVVTASASKEAAEAPPSPFSTSTLLQAASVSLAFNPDKTMRLAQSLFEQGLISYHRTDSLNLDATVADEVRQYAQGQGWKLPDAPRRFKEKDSSQQGHEAIRPTHVEDREAGGSDDEKALYALVWSRAVASQLADTRVRINTLELTASVGAETFVFRARGREVLFPGWRSLTAGDAADEGDDAADDAGGGTVPSLAEGTQATASACEVKAKETKPPARYTQASLVKRLEALGIGRPSTFASLLKNIMERGYVAEEARKLHATPQGAELVVALVKAQFQFIEFRYTQDMEKRLDAIADGKEQYRAVVAGAYEVITGEIQRLKASGALVIAPKHKCPKCGKTLRRFRKADTGTLFWACAGTQDGSCMTYMDDNKGEPVARKEFPCPDCGKPLRRRKGPHGFFWGCTNYNVETKEGCKTLLPDDKGKPGKRAQVSEFTCPACKKNLRRNTKGGKNGYDFYGCTGYPACEQKFQVGKDGKPVFAKT